MFWSTKSKFLSQPIIKLLFLLIIFVLLSGITLEADNTQVKKQTVVRWVYFEDGEPESWKENRAAKGMQVEITDNVFKKLGIRVIYEFYPWERAQEMIKTGEADGMIATPVPVRFEYAVFGKEQAQVFFWNIFIKKGNIEMEQAAKKFTTLEDLKPYNLVDFIGNGWQKHYMKIEDGYNISHVRKIDQIPLMLAKGRCDFVLNAPNWMNWWAEKQGIEDEIQELSVVLPHTRFQLVFMTSRKSPWTEKGLVRAMDKELKKMKESGEWQKILREYKHPHGFGRPFKTQLVTDQFYSDYDKYPVYKPE